MKRKSEEGFSLPKDYPESYDEYNWQLKEQVGRAKKPMGEKTDNQDANRLTDFTQTHFSEDPTMVNAKMDKRADNTIRVKWAGKDKWGRDFYRSTEVYKPGSENQEYFVEVDGVMHSTTAEGEPLAPAPNVVKEDKDVLGSFYIPNTQNPKLPEWIETFAAENRDNKKGLTPIGDILPEAAKGIITYQLKGMKDKEAKEVVLKGEGEYKNNAITFGAELEGSNARYLQWNLGDQAIYLLDDKKAILKKLE